jgi:hypothetical protein
MKKKIAFTAKANFLEKIYILPFLFSVHAFIHDNAYESGGYRRKSTFSALKVLHAFYDHKKTEKKERRRHEQKLEWL